MSINVGLTSSEKYNCILGFSGKIIDKENLLTRIKSKTKIFLTHGDMDEVVQSNHLLEAKDFFIRNKINIETKLISNCDHHISVEASSAAGVPTLPQYGTDLGATVGRASRGRAATRRSFGKQRGGDGQRAQRWPAQLSSTGELA